MKAARYHAAGDVRVEDVPVPTPGPGEVQVRVALNGICGSDLHEFFDGPRAVPMEPHPLTGVRAPVVLGHETAGHVNELGAGVSGVSVGDLVVVDPLRNCGRCPACRVGWDNLCHRLAMHGYSTGGGGLAELTVVPADRLHATPAGMTPTQAALVEPLSIAAHAVGRWSDRTGTSAAVFGAGPIGIAVLLTLRAAGSEDVWVVEPAPERRRIAESLGAHGIDPAAGSPSEQLREATGGAGVDVAFDTAGAPTSFTDAVSSLSKRGTVVVVASGRNQVVAPLPELVRSELTVRTTYASCGEFDDVIAGMEAGRFPLEGWVTTLALDDLVEGFHRLREGRDIKILVDPWAPAQWTSTDDLGGGAP